MARIWRLLATLLLAAAAWSASALLLPGIDETWLQRTLELPTSSVRTPFSVVALGLTPAVSAFILVELAALAVPGWRVLRRGLPEQRRRLVRASLVFTVVIASVQAYFTAKLLQSETFAAVASKDASTTLVLTLSLVGGTFLLLAIAKLIERFGLLDGFSAVLGTAALGSVGDGGATTLSHLQLGGIALGDVLLAVAEHALVVAVTVYLLTAHRRARVPAPLVALRHPTSGFAPVVIAPFLLVLSQSLGPLGVHAPELVPGTLQYELSDRIVVVLLVLVLSAAFNRPRVIAGALTRSSGLAIGTLDDAVRRMLRAATFRSALFVLGLSVIGLVFTSVLEMRVLVDLSSVVVLTAVAMDLVAEWRARREHDDLVPVWPLHQLSLLETALAALRRADIPSHPRAQYNRALLWFFAPYMPVEIMVPAARAIEARGLLETTLLGS